MGLGASSCLKQWTLAFLTAFEHGASGTLIRNRGRVLAEVDLANESEHCVDAFFKHLPELTERPVTLVAPVGSNGFEMPQQPEITRAFFEGATGSQRACAQRRGRFLSIRGMLILPKEMAELQPGAGRAAHFGLCMPRQCPDTQVANSLAVLALQYMLGLAEPPFLAGHTESRPEVEELGNWSAMHVDFVIGGFAKCATTALAEYLDRHPGLQLADVGAGEPYFEDTSFISMDLLPTQRMIRAFRQRHGAPRGQVKIGIKYPHLLFRDLALLKLYAANPAVLLVVLIRDPIDWLESTFRFYSVINTTPPKFHEHALSHDPRRSGLRRHSLEAFFTLWVRRVHNFGFRRRQVYVLHVALLDHGAAARLCGFLGAPGAPPGLALYANVNAVSGFDLCAAMQTDPEVRRAVTQLKVDLEMEYQELPRLLAENDELAPRELLFARSRCEVKWWG